MCVRVLWVRARVRDLRTACTFFPSRVCREFRICHTSHAEGAYGSEAQSMMTTYHQAPAQQSQNPRMSLCWYCLCIVPGRSCADLAAAAAAAAQTHAELNQLTVT
jgi:hypothetical protein